MNTTQTTTRIFKSVELTDQARKSYDVLRLTDKEARSIMIRSTYE